jgi:site-specific DNA recombinase
MGRCRTSRTRQCANYTISGKDYYRCASQKERGTCGNTVSVRKELLETATLAFLQSNLLTEEHGRIFAEEFRRETVRLARRAEHRDGAAQARLRQLKVELTNLYQNLLAGLASGALRTMIAEREAEKLVLKHSHTWRQILSSVRKCCRTLPSSIALQSRCRRYAPRWMINMVRSEAAAVLSTLIESVTIYPAGDHGLEAEVVAKVSNLIAYATNNNAAS